MLYKYLLNEGKVEREYLLHTFNFTFNFSLEGNISKPF